METKYIIFITFFVAVAGKTEQDEVHDLEKNGLRQKMMMDALSCQKKHDASSKDMNFLFNISVPKTRKVACLASCFFREIGIMNPNGTMKIEDAMNLYREMEGEIREYNVTDLRTSMELCNQKQTDTGDECDNLTMYLMCIDKTYEQNTKSP